MHVRETLREGDLVSLDEGTWGHALRDDGIKNGQVILKNQPSGIVVEASDKYDGLWVIYVSKLGEKFLIGAESIRKVSE